MLALEHLFEGGAWRPERGVVLGFGSDEERGGQVGLPLALGSMLEGC